MKDGKKRSSGRELFINILVLGFGSIATKAATLILLPIYTKYMTTSQLGVAELVVNDMNLIFPFATANILSALLRYEMDGDKNRGKVLQNTSVVIFVGMLISGIVLHYVNLSASVDNWKLYLLLLLVSYSLQQIASVMARALDHVMLMVAGNIIYSISLLVGSAFLLIILGRGTAGYLEAMMIANFVSSLFLAIAVHLWKYVIFSKIDFRFLWEMLKFSLPLIVNSVSWWITSYLDRFVLERYMGTGSVGIYSVASKIPVIVSGVAGVFMQAWVLSAIKEYQTGINMGFFDSVFQKFSSLFFCWAASMIFGCKWMTGILVQDGFDESWKYVPLLLFAAVINGFGGYYSAFYTSAKRNGMLMVSTLIGAVINIALNFLFIPHVGIQGAVVATLISQFAVMIFRIIDVGHFFSFHAKMKKFWISQTLILIGCAMLLAGLKMYIVFVPFALVIIINARVTYAAIKEAAKGVRR